MQDHTRCYSKGPLIHSWVLGTVSVFTVMLLVSSNPVLARLLRNARPRHRSNRAADRKDFWDLTFDRHARSCTILV